MMLCPKAKTAWIATFTFLMGALSSSAAYGAEPAGQVIGFYSDGKLENSSALPFEGKGYFHLFRERARHFGSAGLIEVIENAMERFLEWDPGTERLQIGDIAAQFGGPISGHASHQNGLDIDVVYFRKNHQEQDLRFTSGFQESFVTPKGSVTANFDTPRNWKFLSLLIQSGRIERIFVDPAIKREFCRYAGTPDASSSQADGIDTTEMLRRLRPLTNHQDHWHIRLTCPTTSEKCITQTPPVPEGNGCAAIEGALSFPGPELSPPEAFEY